MSRDSGKPQPALPTIDIDIDDLHTCTSLCVLVDRSLCVCCRQLGATDVHSLRDIDLTDPQQLDVLRLKKLELKRFARLLAEL